MAVEWFVGQLPGVQVYAAELSVIVEHLLEVRDKPYLIDAVTGKAAPNLIIHATACHAGKRQVENVGNVMMTGALVATQQVFERHRLGKLGRGAEAAVIAVGKLAEFGQRGVEQGQPQVAIFPANAQHFTFERVGQAICGVLNFAAAVGVGIMDAVQHLLEGRHPVTGLIWVIGAAIEGATVRQEKDGHRPATAPGDRLDSLHVNIVNVGAFFAVHFDVDEQVVHHGGGGLIFKALVGHHMAPVTSTIANAQQDRFVGGLGGLERVGSPGVPIDRIFFVLEEVRAGFVLQTVHNMPLER